MNVSSSSLTSPFEFTLIELAENVSTEHRNARSFNTPLGYVYRGHRACGIDIGGSDEEKEETKRGLHSRDC